MRKNGYIPAALDAVGDFYHHLITGT